MELRDLWKCPTCNQLYIVSAACDSCHYSRHYPHGGMCTIGVTWRPTYSWRDKRRWKKANRMTLPADPGNAPDSQRGLYGKYAVTRLADYEDKHGTCPFFVLDIRHDPFARAAVVAYAEACQREYPFLSQDLYGLLTNVPLEGS